MENKNNNRETQGVFTFGQRVPRTEPVEFETEFIYLDFIQNPVGIDESKIFFSHLKLGEDGKPIVKSHLFNKKGEEGKYQRIGLLLKELNSEKKNKELIIPPVVYDGLVRCYMKYNNNLEGVEIQKVGRGRQTKYFVLPMIKGVNQ